MAVATFARPRTPRSTRAGRSRSRTKAPLEYSILYTATLCLLAAGAVMVYSASSAESVLRNGDPAFYLKRYLMFGALGLATMHLISRRNLRLARNLTPVLLVVSFVLTAAVKVPHVGITVNGATRWLGAGPVQFEPSELLKVSFVHPWNDAGKSGFQGGQAMIALGSGGIFGVGLGESVQKIFYLPEAHTDMILAIVGEELGLIGISALAAVYGLIGYAGFRAAKLARDRYAKLLAAGITSLILCQAALNFFAVLGMAPLTGVPLPFVSYGSSNLVVLLGAMGLLLNVAATGGAAR